MGIGAPLFEFNKKKDGKGKSSTKLKIDPEDIIALGAFLVAVTVAIGLVLGKITEPTAIKIILGCVGAGGVSEAVKYIKRWLHRRNTV